MLRVLACLVIVVLVSGPGDVLARRVHLSEEQLSRLAQIRTVYLSTVVLTEKGRVHSEELVSIVAKRFEDLGFSVLTDSALPYDVEFHVVCEERKRTQGTTRGGGDAELEAMPDRLWHGPACRFRYRLDGADLGWSTEVHTPRTDEGYPLPEPGVPFETSSPFRLLLREVERFDFPVLVMADWGQSERLSALLFQPETPPERRRLILAQLSRFSTASILPDLLTLIQHHQFSQEAIEALAGAGEEGVRHLVAIFQDRSQSRLVRAAAARGLGRIGGVTGNPVAMDPIVEYLTEAVDFITSPHDIEFSVLTAVVWSVGQGHSDRVLRLLNKLQSKIWMYHDDSKEMKALRDAASAVAKQLEHSQL